MISDSPEDWSRRKEDRAPRYRIDLSRLQQEKSDPAALFSTVTKTLCRYLSIHRGLLALDSDKRLTCVSSFNRGDEFRQLSLPMPEQSSLLRKVAEHRFLYTDDYYGLFDGSSLERRLLIDEDTASIAVLPLMYEGICHGVVAYASSQPQAFVGAEEELLLPICEQFARLIAESRLAVAQE